MWRGSGLGNGGMAGCGARVVAVVTIGDDGDDDVRPAGSPATLMACAAVSAILRYCSELAIILRNAVIPVSSAGFEVRNSSPY
jgi:hypothetical protein